MCRCGSSSSRPRRSRSISAQGPPITDVKTSEIFKTWFFVMTLTWSRQQYAEFVREQTVATGLGCHRQVFEWFGGVVERVTIDNAQCAITRYIKSSVLPLRKFRNPGRRQPATPRMGHGTGRQSYPWHDPRCAPQAHRRCGKSLLKLLPDVPPQMATAGTSFVLPAVHK